MNYRRKKSDVIAMQNDGSDEFRSWFDVEFVDLQVDLGSSDMPGVWCGTDALLIPRGSYLVRSDNVANVMSEAEFLVNFERVEC